MNSTETQRFALLYSDKFAAVEPHEQKALPPAGGHFLVYQERSELVTKCNQLKLEAADGKGYLAEVANSGIRRRYPIAPGRTRGHPVGVNILPEGSRER